MVAPSRGVGQRKNGLYLNVFDLHTISLWCFTIFNGFTNPFERRDTWS